LSDLGSFAHAVQDFDFLFRSLSAFVFIGFSSRSERDASRVVSRLNQGGVAAKKTSGHKLKLEESNIYRIDYIGN